MNDLFQFKQLYQIAAENDTDTTVLDTILEAYTEGFETEEEIADKMDPVLFNSMIEAMIAVAQEEDEEDEVEDPWEGMTSEEKILDICSEFDCEFQPYSGRGMMGEYCVAVFVSGADYPRLLKQIQKCGISSITKSDSMGKHHVVYWPKFAVDHAAFKDVMPREDGDAEARVIASLVDTKFPRELVSVIEENFNLRKKILSLLSRMGDNASYLAEKFHDMQPGDFPEDSKSAEGKEGATDIQEGLAKEASQLVRRLSQTRIG